MDNNVLLTRIIELHEAEIRAIKHLDSLDWDLRDWLLIKERALAILKETRGEKNEN